MFKSFQEIEHAVLDSAKRARIALAGAHDLDALSSLVRAREAGIAHGILIGRTEQVREILKRLGQLETDWELIEYPMGSLALGYAGTLDRCGTVYHGRTCILDIKTGQLHGPSHRAQLTAYQELITPWHSTPDYLYALKLSKNGTYELAEVRYDLELLKICLFMNQAVERMKRA